MLQKLIKQNQKRVDYIEFCETTINKKLSVQNLLPAPNKKSPEFIGVLTFNGDKVGIFFQAEYSDNALSMLS